MAAPKKSEKKKPKTKKRGDYVKQASEQILAEPFFQFPISQQVKLKKQAKKLKVSEKSLHTETAV